MRSLVLAAAAILVLAGGAPAADLKPNRHPRYDDRGTLSWSTRLADAQQAAKSSGKIIFIEFGGST
jgi:hypothetical protein